MKQVISSVSFSRETIIVTAAVRVQKIDNFVDTVTGPGLEDIGYVCNPKVNPRPISTAAAEATAGQPQRQQQQQ